MADAVTRRARAMEGRAPAKDKQVGNMTTIRGPIITPGEAPYTKGTGSIKGAKQAT